MSYLEFRHVFSKVSNKCLTTLRLKPKADEKHIEISAPFDFKTGPQMNFPGYSEDDISLMKEKAIASTAISSESGLELISRSSTPMHSGPNSYTCGLGGKVAYHARRVSRGCLHQTHDHSIGKA